MNPLYVMAAAFLALVGLGGKRRRPSYSGDFMAKRYAPGSSEQVALFEAAADAEGLPPAWGGSAALVKILKKESDGWVGIPNYTYGALKKDQSQWPVVWEQLRDGVKTTESSATGLGQLTLPNVDAHYPDGRLGIGNAMNEARGMLSYIAKRYGTPENALAVHNEKGWY